MTPTLFRVPKPVPTPEAWTPDQRLAWAFICSVPNGVYADEIGAHVHSQPGKKWRHDDDARCDFCAIRGRGLATSAALSPHVVTRRGTHKIEPRDPRYRAVLPGSQLGEELPGETFEDLFA